VKVDMKRFDLVKDDAHNEDKWKRVDNWEPSDTASVR